ncbi:type II toxin-antitoxin system HigA family antitoxin [Pseudoduganella sp. UC29_106]|uniref:helix-turn-helix domain-containing protein n=1 Tax=Pseudoduganella sp. UC29_106 TaxID=3374553 RepID=UPI0037571239
MEALIELRVAEIAERYSALSSLVPLGTIWTEDEYDRAVAVLNALLDSGAAERNHPLAGLVETLGLIIGDYDERHFPNAAISPVATLRFLMEQHELTQSDLAEVASQGVMSEILSGKRELNVRQIRALAKRFNVPAGVFLR